MVTLLKNSDTGYYIINSTTDDWITDHAADPGECDLDLLTEGTDYIYIELYARGREESVYNQRVNDIGNGLSFQFTVGKESGIYTIIGTISTATRDKIKKFCKTQNRPTANKIYLVHHETADVFENFYDDALAEKDYTPCVILRSSFDWAKRDPTVIKVTLVCKIFWRSGD